MYEVMNRLEYIQNHGGIMASVFLLMIVYFGWRAVDVFYTHKKIDGVDQRAKDRTSLHELYHHNAKDMDTEEYQALKKKLGL